MFVVFLSWADEVWDCRKGKGINQIDTSGGGKMIRIMVNKATLTSFHIFTFLSPNPAFCLLSLT